MKMRIYREAVIKLLLTFIFVCGLYSLVLPQEPMVISLEFPRAQENPRERIIKGPPGSNQIIKAGVFLRGEVSKLLSWSICFSIPQSEDERYPLSLKQGWRNESCEQSCVEELIGAPLFFVNNQVDHLIPPIDSLGLHFSGAMPFADSLIESDSIQIASIEFNVTILDEPYTVNFLGEDRCFFRNPLNDGDQSTRLTLGGFEEDIQLLAVGDQLHILNSSLQIIPAGVGRVPGDFNDDEAVDISDVVSILEHLFLGKFPELPCSFEVIPTGSSVNPLLDANGDRELDMSDVLQVLSWKFLGGPPHVLGTECTFVPGCEEECE